MDTRTSTLLNSERKEIVFSFGGRTFRINAMSEAEQAEYERAKAKEKAEEKKRSLERLKVNSLIDERFKTCKFDNFIITNENKKLFKFARYYVDNFQEMKANNCGLLFFGRPGSGKSYLSFCIANALLEKYISVIAITSNGLLQKIRELSTFGSTELNSLYRNLNRVSLLIIDDLGAEASSEYNKSKIYEVIDGRYRANKPIIITTNLNPNDFKRKLTSQDEVARTFDRIAEMCEVIEMNYKSFREKKKENKSKAFENILKDLK
ncbi:ATP-binding protein [Peptoniphilus sp. SGI.035]|uniref:ATP-binding protein n=1 Tax=Peptoniphilus sp. SGI.035 TaxID=3420564 RepID=UPI003D01DF28